MLYVFKIIGKKSNTLQKRERASSRLRKDNTTGTFGNTITCPNCWNVRGALSQSISDNWAVSQELWDAILKGRVDSSTRNQASSNANAKFQFTFLEYKTEF